MRLFNLTPRRGDQERALSLRDELNNLFDSFFGDTPLRRNVTGELQFMPKVDVMSNDESVILKAELPGMDASNIDLEVAPDHIRLTGEKKSEYEETRDNVRRVERSFGSFERIIPLPVEVNPEAATAQFHNGVLTVTVTRAEPTPKARKVDIQKAP